MNNTRKKTAIGAGGILLVAVVAWLALGFFGIQSAFIDDEVSEADPVFSASVKEQNATAATEDFRNAMSEAERSPNSVDEPMADTTDSSTEQSRNGPAAPGEIVTLASGGFSGASRYEIDGDALVLGNGTGQRFLRFENFAASNGPDLKVYLRADNGDHVSLGDLKGNIGNQNYEIPVDVDLSVFSAVEIWCERFGVGFGSASLT